MQLTIIILLIFIISLIFYKYNNELFISNRRRERLLRRRDRILRRIQNLIQRAKRIMRKPFTKNRERKIKNIKNKIERNEERLVRVLTNLGKKYVHFYYVDWCEYSEEAMKEGGILDTLKNEYDINVIYHNCTYENCDNIEHYPQIKLQNQNNVSVQLNAEIIAQQLFLD